MSEINHIERKRWSEVSQRVKDANVTIYSMLQNVSKILAKDMQDNVFLVEYCFGHDVVNNGIVNPPCEDSDTSNCDCTSIVEKEFTYSAIPLSLVLEETVEVTDTVVDRRVKQRREPRHRVVPLRIINKGDLFGVYEVLDALENTYDGRQVTWSVTAGSRSLMILANFELSDLQLKLAELGEALAGDSDKGLNPKWIDFNESGWRFVKYLSSYTAPWKTTVLIFPKQWIFGTSQQHLLFHNSLRIVDRLQSRWNRDYIPLLNHLAVLWDEYMFEKGWIRPKEKLGAILSLHAFLLLMQNGQVPAYVPVIDEAPSGPIVETQRILAEAFADIPSLKKYYPLIFQPRHLTTEGLWRSGICSLKEPHLLAPFPPSFKNYKAIARAFAGFHDYFKNEARAREYLLNRPTFWVGGKANVKIDNAFLRHKKDLRFPEIKNLNNRSLQFNLHHIPLAALAQVYSRGAED